MRGWGVPLNCACSFSFGTVPCLKEKLLVTPYHELVQLLGTDFFALAEESLSYTYASMPAEVLRHTHTNLYIYTYNKDRERPIVGIIFYVY